RTPEAIAVVQGRQQLTYAALNARSNHLAHRLIKHGMGPESLIGIWMERSIDLIVGTLGALKAGCGCLHLDSAYPPDRLAFMLADADAAMLLTQESVRDRLPFDQARTLCVDSDGLAVDVSDIDDPAGRTHVDNLAYVIYTSGSTGQPK